MMSEKSNILLDNKSDDADEQLHELLRGPFKIQRRPFMAADPPSQQNDDLDDVNQYLKPQKPTATVPDQETMVMPYIEKKKQNGNNIHQNQQSRINDEATYR